MLSPGGKRRWICPECDSDHISYQHERVFAPFQSCIWTQGMGTCADCNHFFSWRFRKKVKPSFKSKSVKIDNLDVISIHLTILSFLL